MRVTEGIGTGTLDIAPDVLTVVLAHLPRAYRVIGSDRGADGFIRLIVESAEIAAGQRVALTVLVEDVGSCRTARVAPSAFQPPRAAP